MFRKILTGLVVSVVVAAAWALPVVAGPDTVIVMPARTRVVQLAFQVARVKDVALVAYNNSPTLAAPLVHVWNGREWLPIGIEEYVSGTFLPSAVEHVFVLGDSTSLPAAMTEAPSWAKHVHKTADLNVANLLNEFGPVLKFNSAEWRWLAEQNGLQITDRNAERRRYGRWGKSDVETPTLKPAQSPVVELPPEAPVPAATKEQTTPLTTPEVKVETPKEPTAAKVSEAPKPAPAAPTVMHLSIPAAAAGPAQPVVAPVVVAPATNAPANSTPVVTDPTTK